MPPLLNLLDLPSSLLVEALSSLPPASAASLACSSKALINVADDETLRKQHLLDIYGISSFKSPPSHMTCTDTTLPPSSFNEAFKSWAEAFPTRVYKNEMVKVAHNAWQKVRAQQKCDACGKSVKPLALTLIQCMAQGRILPSSIPPPHLPLSSPRHARGATPSPRIKPRCQPPSGIQDPLSVPRWPAAVVRRQV